MSAPPVTGVPGGMAVGVATGAPGDDRPGLEARTSAVAWPAIIGGAFAAAALTPLILLALGANTARKAGATLSIVTGLSMLVGAFIACVAAALGGRQRDAHL